jgi:hypothetical protein
LLVRLFWRVKEKVFSGGEADLSLMCFTGFNIARRHIKLSLFVESLWESANMISFRQPVSAQRQR